VVAVQQLIAYLRSTVQWEHTSRTVMVAYNGKRSEVRRESASIPHTVCDSYDMGMRGVFDL